ncbi:MAG: hypothetical protein PUA70_02650, partial [Oribacterium sp.]|nr:hypothetical protein [Oribacterium sp.]
EREARELLNIEDPRNREESRRNTEIDGLLLQKFSMGLGMAGKTLKFSLSRGGRQNLERVLRLIREHDLHPGIFITEHYTGLDKAKQALYDMKDRKAIKISVEI